MMRLSPARHLRLMLRGFGALSLLLAFAWPLTARGGA
jgi:hypothetical protein